MITKRPYRVSHTVYSVLAKDAERRGQDKEAASHWRNAAKASTTFRLKSLYAKRWLNAEMRYGRKVADLFLSNG